MTRSEPVAVAGRIALATQGVLYAIVGVLAIDVARGDRGARPSQRGAIEATARQPFGRVLLGLLVVGLVIHGAWRLALAIRGDPGDDDDAGSAAKRAANVGRAAIYAGFAIVAVRVLIGAADRGGGRTAQGSTSDVLSWPAGPALVVAAGLVVIGTALWNVKKGVTRSFLDNLDVGRLDGRSRKVLEASGSVGYVARGLAFGLVGWFLANAGLHRNAAETRTLDQALHELAAKGHGVVMLALLAGGLIAFGAFRILDGVYRRRIEVTNS